MKKINSLMLAGALIFGWGMAQAEVDDGLGKSFGGGASTSPSGAPLPPNHPPMGNMQQNTMRKPAMMQPQGPVSQGKVVDVTNGAGYSYLKVEAGGKQFWIAGTQVSAKKGDVVSYIENVIMENFHSKTLNRTFDRIIFASSVKVVK